MNDITEALREQVEKTLAAGISEDAITAMQKAVSNIMVQVEDDVMYRLKDDLAPNLSVFVAEMADKVIEAILSGNESMMRHYLSCKTDGWTGRSENNVWQKNIAEQHPIIHGKLFEQGCVALRKSIVEAHRDLLVNERILDLEDQVKSLVAQVNKANADRDAMWERVRGAA